MAPAQGFSNFPKAEATTSENGQFVSFFNAEVVVVCFHIRAW